MKNDNSVKAVRGSFFDITRVVDQPEEIESNARLIEDGLLIIRNGCIDWFGEWEEEKLAFRPRYGCAIIAAR